MTSEQLAPKLVVGYTSQQGDVFFELQLPDQAPDPRQELTVADDPKLQVRPNIAQLGYCPQGMEKSLLSHESAAKENLERFTGSSLAFHIGNAGRSAPM